MENNSVGEYYCQAINQVKIYTTANSVDEVRTMFSVLELGTDGVIFTTNDENQVSKLGSFLENVNFPLQSSRIVEIKDVGPGERVCIDTASMLKTGEGLLVGSKQTSSSLSTTNPWVHHSHHPVRSE